MILSAKYDLNVKVFDSHYHAGGCAHSFPIKSKQSGATYNFDSGPTIMLGCSKAPYNPLQQVFRTIGAESLVNWIPYNSWGMYSPESGNWVFELGKNKFESGPLKKFGGDFAIEEFKALKLTDHYVL
jgi:phytoene dehydrogenase-like protein